MEITIFNGKIHYKWSFSIATLNYQRVGPISLGGLIHHGAVRNLAPPVDPPGIGVHLLFRNAPAQEWGDGHGETVVVICTPCMV